VYRSRSDFCEEGFGDWDERAGCLGKCTFQRLPDVGIGGGFLEPADDVRECLFGETGGREQRAFANGGSVIITISGEPVGRVVNSGLVHDLEVGKLRELLPPAPEAAIVGLQQVGGEHEFGEIPVVGVDLKITDRSSEEVSIPVKGINDGVEFLVGDIPAFLSGLKLVVAHHGGSPDFLVVLLHDDDTVGFIGGVRVQAAWLVGIMVVKEDIITETGKKTFPGASMECWVPGPGYILLEESGKASGDIGVVGNQVSEPTKLAENRVEVPLVSGRLQITEGLDFVVRHSKALTQFNGVSKERDLLAEPLALLWLEGDLVLLESLQDGVEMSDVLFPGAGEDHNVVKVGSAISEVGVQDVVDEPLEDGRCVEISHGDNRGFEEGILGLDGKVLLGIGVHTNVGEPPGGVHDGQEPFFPDGHDVLEDLASEGNGVVVRNRIGIEWAEVEDQAELSLVSGLGRWITDEERRC